MLHESTVPKELFTEMSSTSVITMIPSLHSGVDEGTVHSVAEDIGGITVSGDNELGTLTGHSMFVLRKALTLAHT